MSCIVHWFRNDLRTADNLALSIAAIGVLPKQNKVGFDIHRNVLHSLTVARLAKLLCAMTGGQAI
mgnify:CR=1 FL=1